MFWLTSAQRQGMNGLKSIQRATGIKLQARTPAQDCPHHQHRAQNHALRSTALAPRLRKFPQVDYSL
jgi:hypothetical protein